jgi:hypothetical protein
VFVGSIFCGIMLLEKLLAALENFNTDSQLKLYTEYMTKVAEQFILAEKRALQRDEWELSLKIALRCTFMAMHHSHAQSNSFCINLGRALTEFECYIIAIRKKM